ncbi:helix-turn-helix domain-containing protein [Bifidobacterium cebidarum]|uniref:Helix-turn-helix domain-containing protein n=1 Tax=Bifidobacterium cebidarum TaxID=2650773 RepID=A0A6I1G803_9BIFI|nr:helix-turn-helix domain-containing protein [Bifidobacterium cebidarum]KAB7786982.1 hypothetical protein F7D08_1578 [Bifidobacterium cebidarum]
MSGYITIAEAAEMTGKTVESLRKRISRGTLKGVKQGDRWLIPRDAVTPDTIFSGARKTGEHHAADSDIADHDSNTDQPGVTTTGTVETNPASISGVDHTVDSPEIRLLTYYVQAKKDQLKAINESIALAQELIEEKQRQYSRQASDNTR